MTTMIPVKSSVLSALGYDPEKEELYAEFMNGNRYVYRGVPSILYDRLLKSPSIGGFFMKNIMGTFKCQKLPSKGKS
jgi:hypothetical protein